MNKTTLGLTFFLFALTSTPSALAEQTNILFASASQYRNAVAKLDRVLSDSREIRPADRNMVDRLSLAAKRMVVAAKNPRNVNRLRFEWKRVIPLQLEVERDLFENYSPNLELVRTWEYLLWTQAIFEQEFAFFVEDPRRGNATKRRIESTQPNRYLLSPDYRPYLPPPPVAPFNTVLVR